MKRKVALVFILLSFCIGIFLLSSCSSTQEVTDLKDPNTEEYVDTETEWRDTDIEKYSEEATELKDTETKTYSEEAEGKELTEEFIFSTSVKVVDTTLYGSNGNMSEIFPISTNLKNYKVWINNTSDSHYNVTITYGSAGGKLLGSYKVKAGKSKTLYFEADDTMERYINITSSNGAELQGELAVRIGKKLKN
ncbi:hypothetical protein [Caldalkalibacillus mannanilyticus]|uniref:hypothetical protein n=1 Tax=Caldalkalibacillus mannanilyticus TaxID=1418 RepID=UPI000468D32F|nr:hypothetical protein [Caldalkalibacillus mannanilyticus]